MKMLKKRLYLAFLSILLISGVSAQSPHEFHVNADWVDEGYVPNVPVSGRIIMGTMFVDAGQPNGDSLYISVSSSLAGTEATHEEDVLCINLISRDGSYTGIWKVKIDELEPPYLLEVQYSTKQPAFYEDNGGKQLVALVTIKDHCGPGGKTQRILPVAWQRPKDSHRLRVFINSSRMRTLLAIPYIENNVKGVEVIECKKIDAPQRISFDRQCDIKDGEPGRELQYDQAQLLRYRGPNRAPIEPFPLLR